MNMERNRSREERIVSRILLLGILILGGNLTWALLDFQLSHQATYITLQSKTEVFLAETINAHGDNLFSSFTRNQCAMVMPSTEECKRTVQQVSIDHVE